METGGKRINYRIVRKRRWLGWLDGDVFGQIPEFPLLRPLPTLSSYFGYLFTFQGVMVGPFMFYYEYDNFIEGRPQRKEVGKAVLSKTSL